MTGRAGSAAAIVSGLLIGASFPLGPPLPLSGHEGWWPAAWVALVPLLLTFARGSSRPRRAFFEGWVAGVIGYGLVLSWMIPFLRNWGHLGALPALGVFGLLVFYLASYVGAWAWMVRLWCARLGVPAACLLAPAAWTGLELVRSHLLGGFPWALLGVSQHAVPGAIQIADTTGVYGVSFVLVAASSLVCLAVSGPAVRTPGGAGAAAALMAAIAVSLAHGPPAAGDTTIDAALIQSNVRQAMKWDPAERDRIEADHDRMTREAASGGAGLILWSESSVPLSITRDASYAARVARLARETGAEIVLGSVAYEQEGGVRVPYNSAFLVRPDTGIAGRYDKRRLVPFGEYVPLERLFFFIESVVAEAGDFRPGTAAAPLRSGAASIGPLICYEAIFPALSRDLARSGATVLANLTNDAWYAGTAMPAQHLAHSVFRAVETRRPLLRCASTGISAAIDADGRIAARAPADEAVILRVRAAPAGAPTLYVLLGDVFAAACAIVALLAAAHACLAGVEPARPGGAQPAGHEPGSHLHA